MKNDASLLQLARKYVETGPMAGAQSLAIVMRVMVVREIPADKAKQLILKETGIGFINGLVIGVVTGLIAWLRQGMPYPWIYYRFRHACQPHSGGFSPSGHSPYDKTFGPEFRSMLQYHFNDDN